MELYQSVSSSAYSTDSARLMSCIGGLVGDNPETLEAMKLRACDEAHRSAGFCVLKSRPPSFPAIRLHRLASLPIRKRSADIQYQIIQRSTFLRFVLLLIGILGPGFIELQADSRSYPTFWLPTSHTGMCCIQRRLNATRLQGLQVLQFLPLEDDESTIRLQVLIFPTDLLQEGLS